MSGFPIDKKSLMWQDMTELHSIGSLAVLEIKLTPNVLSGILDFGE